MVYPIETEEDQWDYSMIKSFTQPTNLSKSFNASSGYRARQSTYLNGSRFSDGLYAQAARAYLGEDVNEDTLESSLDSIYKLHDCMDFRINGILKSYNCQKAEMVMKPSPTKIVFLKFSLGAFVFVIVIPLINYL